MLLYQRRKKLIRLPSDNTPDDIETKIIEQTPGSKPIEIKPMPIKIEPIQVETLKIKS